MESQRKNGKIDKHTLMSDAFYALPEPTRLEIRLEVCDKLGIGTSTFYNRLRGTRFLKKTEIPFIEKIFRNHGIEVFKQPS